MFITLAIEGYSCLFTTEEERVWPEFQELARTKERGDRPQETDDSAQKKVKHRISSSGYDSFVGGEDMADC